MPSNKPPKTIGEAIQRLKLFNEKILTLRRRNFIPQVFRPNHGITLRVSPDTPLTFERRGADEEALHAVINTLRFFVQPRDGICLKQMAELYERLPVEDKAKQSARAAADSIDTLLDAPLQISMNGETLTKRRLFEVFMYGDVAHANDDKRPDYEKWMKHPAAAALMPTYLEQIIAEIIRVVVSFDGVNERTIRQLETLPPDQLI